MRCPVGLYDGSTGRRRWLLVSRPVLTARPFDTAPQVDLLQMPDDTRDQQLPHPSPPLLQPPYPRTCCRRPDLSAAPPTNAPVTSKCQWPCNRSTSLIAGRCCSTPRSARPSLTHIHLSRVQVRRPRSVMAHEVRISGPHASSPGSTHREDAHHRRLSYRQAPSSRSAGADKTKGLGRPRTTWPTARNCVIDAPVRRRARSNGERELQTYEMSKQNASLFVSRQDTVDTIAQIPLGSSRHVSTRSTCRASQDERVERVDSSCYNMADDKQAIVLACTSLVVFMLLQILFVPSNKIN